MGNKQIDNPAKLQAWADNTDNKIDRLTEAVEKQSDIKELINRDTERPTFTREQAEGFGKAVRGLVRNAGRKLEYKSYEKADIGTPLVSDAVTGSYAVGTQYLNQCIRLAEYKSALRPYVTVVDMDALTAVIPKKVLGFDFTYIATQTADTTEQTPTFTTETLTSYQYAGYVGINEAFLDDSLFNFGSYMSELVSDALARKFDNEFLNGSGSPTTGILNDPDVESVTFSGIGFGDVEPDELIDMIAKLTQKQERVGAVWMMHPTILDMLMKKRNADGDYIFNNIGLWERGYPKSLLGYPIVLSNELPELTESDVETPFIAFGNPRYMYYGNRKELSLKWLDATRAMATNLEILFLAYFRAAFCITLPTAFCVGSTAAS